MLRDQLVGVYLHGSAAYGGFVPGHSDIDVLAVSSASLSEEQKRAIADGLSQDALPCPARELELSLVTLPTIREPPELPAFELHISTGDNPHWIDGAKREGDADLVVHFAHVRDHGRAIAGPEPRDVFGPVARRSLMNALLLDARWAARKAPLHYQVLNACRVSRFLEEGSLCSKIEGARWAAERTTDPSVVEAAVVRQKGGDARLDEQAVRAFVVPIIQALEDALQRLDGGP